MKIKFLLLLCCCLLPFSLWAEKAPTQVEVKVTLLINKELRLEKAQWLTLGQPTQLGEGVEGVSCLVTAEKQEEDWMKLSFEIKAQTKDGEVSVQPRLQSRLGRKTGLRLEEESGRVDILIHSIRTQ